MSGPKISIETPQENQIFEITYDGREIPQPPLSMSENLARLAAKIDWSRSDGEEDGDEAAPSSAEGDGDADSQVTTFQQPTWPWESVRNKIRDAYTEVCVLSDVLSIARHKRYMVLDGVTQDAPEPKQIIQVISKKKGLAAAAQILSEGAERMRENLAEQRRNRNNNDFYTELLRLRQKWRLRKVGNNIIGDLSYKQVGSRFWLSGTFEVKKAEENAPALPPPAPGLPPVPPSPIIVTVPSELQGAAFIYVTIRKDQETLCSARLTHPGSTPLPVPQSQHWSDRLDAAQNVLFCKELIAQLAREAVQLQPRLPHMVIGNEITSTIFPGIHLVMGLAHSARPERRPAAAPLPPVPAGPLGDNNYVLEHSLHQLLRHMHHRNMHHAMPHPASAPMGMSKRRRQAGPGAASRGQLLKMVESETLLESIIRQARHVVLRMRTAFAIDSCAREIKDPLIVTHWNSVNSPTQSCCKVNIMTHGYDSVHRTTFLINVLEDSLRCVCRDGRVMTVSYETSELHYIILCQVSQHNLLAAQSLGRIMGWTVKSSSSGQGGGGGGGGSDSSQTAQSGGGAASSSCVLSAPGGHCYVAVRCQPHGEPVAVSVAQSPKRDFFPTALVTEHKWEHLGGAFRQIKWEKMEGRNFLNKMELLMANLSSGTGNIM
ncbi:mediator of RNA polymerase II transcription subunit 17-like [Amphibalanus amphitrite]|uniref:mediator of RNA polymerase II transcription subunit 17-like n=1 Tax=Amphibalanus amphitrite TaxID=1232801 RepID=UPI001C8FF7E5|nr:mediator of RNA polymerase II transcription subunit 17-like [Amphibalanus amphitrite]XP_043235604.1 mediator of RNA polymerase II transcription subunit 17-like [Amphibalanus amphitrite]XP_043235605.1 mediator of RNA polymerase II transcription subunit 17-like [Amphibalanus amphitrite]XP_043235606.1 mediator of RNA polymerase II transcription subunit 17-like [Amphibalanus amphitrite]XP_043235607.1 mediator of RNA polymerase II transcription subunit 17-like [Amphibalanus amphitrite]XP_0432356